VGINHRDQAKGDGEEGAIAKFAFKKLRPRILLKIVNIAAFATLDHGLS
jgi:hypothetical protein